MVTVRSLPLVLCLLLPAAGAADFGDWQGALRRARAQQVRGEVTVTVNFPPRATPTRPARALPLMAFRPALIERNFTVTRAGQEVLAGRLVTRFDLVPKAGQAARWSLWVDQVWQLPLGYAERSANGTLARQALFVKVSAQPVKVAQPVPPLPQGLRAAVLRALPGLLFPAGFVPSGVQDRPAGGMEVSLTDGANVLALVIAPRAVRQAPGVASRRVGGAFVWLVGNLPQAELDSALAGIRRVDQAALGTLVGAASSKP